MTTKTPTRPKRRPTTTAAGRAGGARARRATARRNGKRSSRSPRNTAVVVGVAVLFAALVYAAFGIERDTGPTVEEIAGSPEISGEALPVLGEGTDPALGSAAPVVSGDGFDGSAATIGEGTELVVFLASWCSFCRQELPELVTWLDAGNLPDGVELTAVITGLDPVAPNWPPDDWLAREGYTGDVVVDDADGSVAAAYGMSGTPFWVTIDEGQVVARSAGLLGMDAVGQLAAAIAG